MINNASDVFRILGVVPTSDKKILDKAFRTKYIELQRKIADANIDDESRDKFMEDQLILNQAWNIITESRTNQTLAGLVTEAESHQELKSVNRKAKGKKEVTYDDIEFDSTGLPKTSKDLELLMELTRLETEREEKGLDAGTNLQLTDDAKRMASSLSLRLKEYSMPLEEEEITFNAFVNGTKYMMDNNELIDIPAGFLGTLTNFVDGKIQMIRVVGKNSLVFNYSAQGNLVLKRIPKNATFNNGILEFNFSDKDFSFDLNKGELMEIASGKKSVLLLDGQGVVPYGLDKAGYLLINPTTISSHDNEKVEEEVRDFINNL